MTTFSILLRASICAAFTSVLIGVACGQTQVDSAFTYQGQLLENGAPANGPFDIEFKLWDAATGGNQIGNEIENDELPVVNGNFTVELDFGYVFNGDDRWLQIAVNGVELSPRVEITATPYAISAGSIPGGLFGDSWTGSSAASGLSITNSGTSGTGLYGLATAITGQTKGVHGSSASTTGRGVYGHATSTTGSPTGVYGESDANFGRGVYGESDYIGVFGEGFNNSPFQGYPVGVFGRSNDSGGRGVWGTAPTLGVYGVATSGSGATRGVYGETPSTTGHGVHGLATATSGEAHGVYGTTSSSDGAGVYGRGPTGGVVGVAFGNSGAGVAGEAIGGGTLAGFFTGDVFITEDLFVGGDKGFVHEHPNDPTKELVYICLEGGEAGTYIRGSAELCNGEARVELPEHFALVTNAEGVTATLTPVGSYLQLYIAEQAADHLLVREASGKDGQFNYLVQGTRKGLENHQVIRDRIPRPVTTEPSGTPIQSGDGTNQ